MSKKCIVLLTGLPGSGKSTLAEKLVNKYGGSHINADEVRAAIKDWDFSIEGRRRQFERMRASTEGKEGFVFLDFVCPVNAWRDEMGADLIVWMDTIQVSRYEDTNKAFEPPVNYDLRITSFDEDMLSLFDDKMNTTIKGRPAIRYGSVQKWGFAVKLGTGKA